MRAADRATRIDEKDALFNEADRAFRRALALQPNAGNAAVGLYCLYINAPGERLAQAEALLVQALQVRPVHVSTIAALEWFTKCAGAASNAVSEAHYVAVMDDALDATRSRPELYAWTLIHMANYYGRFKANTSGAVAFAEKAHLAMPDDAAVDLVLARWYTADKQYDKALAAVAEGELADGLGTHSGDFSDLRAVIAELQRNPAARIQLY